MYFVYAAGSLCCPHHHHWHPRQGSLSGEADPPICVQRSRVQLSPCCKSLSPRSEAVCSSLKSQGRGCKRVWDREIYREKIYPKKTTKMFVILPKPGLRDPDLAGSGSGWIWIWLDPDLVRSWSGWIRIWLAPDLVGSWSGWIRIWLDPDLVGSWSGWIRIWLDPDLVGSVRFFRFRPGY